jgi:hypothetical protein
MELKAFAQYIQNKSLSQLLHRVRKKSLKRILAHAGSAGHGTGSEQKAINAATSSIPPKPA